MRLYAFVASSSIHSAELIGSGGFWGDAGTSSLPVMSCHLLCFPFALEMSPEKVAQILQSYHSANVVKGLVQVHIVVVFVFFFSALFALTYFVLYVGSH